MKKYTVTANVVFVSDPRRTVKSVNLLMCVDESVFASDVTETTLKKTAMEQMREELRLNTNILRFEVWDCTADNSTNVEFKSWGKIPRHDNLKIVISEKYDGTNGCIIIKEGKLVGVQSRNKLITPEDDNYGFARWVHENEEDLVKLGDGYHYGEWYGLGIQKNPHNLDCKRFVLFNTHRPIESVPQSVGVVRVLYVGEASNEVIDRTFKELKQTAALEGYEPEGIIINNISTRSLTKMTYKNHKGKWVDTP